MAKKRTKYYYCQDCGKLLTATTPIKRCRACYALFCRANPQLNPKYKDGRTIRPHFCTVCQQPISKSSALYGNGKCRKCGNKKKKLIRHLYFCIDCHSPVKYKKTLRCRACNDKFKVGKKLNCNRYGAKNPNYKDGRKPLCSSIRESKQYRAWRTEVFTQYSYTCQSCGQIGGALHVHHKIPFHCLFNRFIRKHKKFNIQTHKLKLLFLAFKWRPFWDINNGLVLCTNCHKQISTRRDM